MLLNRLPLLISLLILSLSVAGQRQKVGVVLSGGGASGIAHIGFLKALEENNIPIDYITGTSMGAVIGGLYASGISVEDLETYFSSDEFIDAVGGKLDARYSYFFKKGDADASMIGLKIDPDTFFLRTIPAYVVSPVQMDMEMMEAVSSSIAKAGYDFDSLYIPFRCVASDIVAKEEVVFSGGELHKALRASASFPFYFKPIEMDGRILFDGGLYNNYPVDLMYEEFSPDVILGSSVSLKTPAPMIDDLFSQIENMIVNRGSESIPCEHGLTVKPDTQVGTLEFTRGAEALQIGYISTIAMMDSILKIVDVRQRPEARDSARKEWTKDLNPYDIKEITVSGVGIAAIRYFTKVLRAEDKRPPATLEELKPLYFRVLEDDKISSAFPSIRYDEEKGGYVMNIDIQKEKKLFIDFGGNFSSIPVNTGFVALRYNILGSTPKSLMANSYFGKFYNSLLVEARFDIPNRNPYYFSFSGVRQQWDYFRSFATFFQETKPSFILQQETVGAISMGRPVGNKGKLLFDVKGGENEDEYYQTDIFSATDTADITHFTFLSAGLGYERNTLNRKLYPNKGTYLSLRTRYIEGQENTIPGSSGILSEEFKGRREWFVFRARYENYFKTIGNLRIGMELEGAYSTQPFFSNRKASLLASPYFQPIPESKTLFQDEFRAHQFMSAGLKLVYSITNSVDFRLENYIFQPVNEILPGEGVSPVYSEDFLKRFYIGSGSAVFHSPLGPVSISLNYYDQREEPWSWIINFGYLIFNKRALD